MAVISFDDKAEAIWGGTGWAFRQIVRDLSPYAEGDSDFVQTLERAGHLGSLIVENLDPSLQRRITRAIVAMTNDIVSGERSSSIPQFHTDQETQELYWKYIEMLRSIAERSARGAD